MIRQLSWMLLPSVLLAGFGCGGSKEEVTNPAPVISSSAVAPETAPPKSESPKEAPPAPAIEISPFVHHAAGDVALVIARPSRILNNPILTEIVKEIETADPSVNFEEQLKQIEAQLKIDPKQIEYLVASVSSKTLAAVSPKPSASPDFSPPSPRPDAPGSEQPNADPNATDEKAPAESEGATAGSDADSDPFAPPQSPAILVRLLTPIDGPALMAKMEAEQKAMAEKYQFPVSMDITRSVHGELTLYQNGESPDRICFLNPQTILYAPESVVKATIDRKGTAESTPLSNQLQTLVDRDFAVAIDLAPVDAMAKSGQLELPFPVQIFAGPLLKCRSLSLAADINGGNLLQVNLVAADEAGAKQLHGMLNPMLTDAITKAKAAKNTPDQIPAEASPFLPLVEKILDGTALTQTGDLLTLAIARPAGLEELPKLAHPMIVEAARRSQEARARNDLKYISLGMHNFHDTHNHFPSNNQGGNESMGLSWRVHILPYVGEATLYGEFHLDEPWDSEHNKALIPKMPSVYGSSVEGKTSIHVFVGEGTPFGGKPLSIRDFIDGTSSTIMFVKAGDDTADSWTKPGGLIFDKANPVSTLGDIEDRFEVGFMDGSVRSLPKSIEPATLADLILHTDGHPVEIPD